MKEVKQYIIDDLVNDKGMSIISANANVCESNNFTNQMNFAILDKEGFVEKYDEVKNKLIEVLDKMKEDIEKSIKNE